MSLLRSIRIDRRRPQSLAPVHGTTRQRIYRLVERFVSAGLVDRASDGIVLTPSGMAVLEAYVQARAELGVDAIRYLAGSENRPAILRAPRDGSARKRNLSHGESAPSRTTVHRSIHAFQERGWVATDADGRHALTDAGSDALAASDRLRTIAEQAIEKAPFLNRFGAYRDLLSLEPFSEADLVVPTIHEGNPMFDTSVELAKLRTDPVAELRSAVPIFTPVMFEVFRPLIDHKTRIWVAFDWKAYRQLITPETIRYLFAALAVPAIRVRVLDEDLPYGVGLFDDAMMVAVRMDASDPGVAITATHPDLYAWARGLFDEHWADGTDISNELHRHARQLVSESQEGL